jgi:hypothetical protein
MGLGEFVTADEDCDVLQTIMDVPHLAIDIEVEPDEEVSVASLILQLFTHL